MFHLARGSGHCHYSRQTCCTCSRTLARTGLENIRSNSSLRIQAGRASMRFSSYRRRRSSLRPRSPHHKRMFHLARGSGHCHYSRQTCCTSSRTLARTGLENIRSNSSLRIQADSYRRRRMTAAALPPRCWKAERRARPRQTSRRAALSWPGSARALARASPPPAPAHARGWSVTGHPEGLRNKHCAILILVSTVRRVLTLCNLVAPCRQCQRERGAWSTHVDSPTRRARADTVSASSVSASAARGSLDCSPGEGKEDNVK